MPIKDKKKRAEYTKKYYAQYSIDNAETLKERDKANYQKNKEQRKKAAIIQVKKWKEAHREQYKEYRREHQKYRRNNDINFKIRDNLTTRVWFALNGGIKSVGTIEMLGCSIECLKSHLEGKFKEGMTWNNYGKSGWHIDHIKPCSAFNLSDKEEQLKCFNYTNLQPLWWYENLEKSNKY